MSARWRSVRREDTEIAYLDTGGDAPVLVLLHGLAGYAGEWAATVGALRSERRVVALDLRGHGASTRRPRDVGPAAFAADVLAVLDDLGVDRAAVAGQSLGGHVAMLVAAAAPERVEALVMAEAGLGGASATETEAVTGWLASWPAPFADREEFVAFFGGEAPAAQAWADGLAEGPGGLRPRWDADVLARALTPVHAREHHAEWSLVEAPTLLVLGEHSTVPRRQVEAMVTARPGTEVVTLSRTGHDVHLEAPGPWAATLRDFLARTASGP